MARSTSRCALVASVVTMIAGAGLAPAAAATKKPPTAATKKPPSAAQIRTDVANAVHSPTLWATVNICDTPADPGVLGIRGQMPALGFPAQLSMTVRLYYWSFKTSSFQPVAGVEKHIVLGTVTSGTIQDGATFTFKPPVILEGSITYHWRYQGKLLASVTKATSHGDKGVQDGDPSGYSTATCRMGE
jgi:hypothetical protein